MSSDRSSSSQLACRARVLLLRAAQFAGDPAAAAAAPFPRGPAAARAVTDSTVLPRV